MSLLPALAGGARGPMSLLGESLRGVAVALAAAVLLAWPMLLVTAPLTFPDTLVYVNQGHEFVHLVLNAVLPGGSEGHRADEYLSSRSLRSAPYAAFVYLTSRIGLVAPALLQAAAVLLMLGALVRREAEASPVYVTTAVVLCGALTSLPWFVSFLMPDILAAGVVLYAMVLVRSFELLDPVKRVLLAAIAVFATTSHYGHVPLAAVCSGAALLLLLVQGRLTWALTLAGTLPVVLAVGMNTLLGLFAYDGASVAPRRLPLLLARSIEDGPARWHLEEHCGTESYAVCGLFEGDVPDDVAQALWGERGLSRLSLEEQAQVREEELVILWRAFLSYPHQQIWSFVGNGVKQLASMGTRDFEWAEIDYAESGALGIEFDPERLRGLLDGFGWIHGSSFGAGLLLLVWLAWSDGLRVGEREREALAVFVVGMLANAAIFGGLSAPADRYQSRIAWIVPVLAALYLLERARQARSATREMNSLDQGR